VWAIVPNAGGPGVVWCMLVNYYTTRVVTDKTKKNEENMGFIDHKPKCHYK
jgi:hypothetical protein